MMARAGAEEQRIPRRAVEELGRYPILRFDKCRGRNRTGPRPDHRDGHREISSVPPWAPSAIVGPRLAPAPRLPFTRERIARPAVD